MSWFTQHADALHQDPTTPACSLNAAFQPSASGFTMAMYTIQHVAAHGNDGTVTLLSDAANPPTTARCSTRLAVTDDAAAVTSCQQLFYIVPPGHYVKLVSAGTGTPTIANQTEAVIT